MKSNARYTVYIPFTRNGELEFDEVHFQSFREGQSYMNALYEANNMKACMVNKLTNHTFYNRAYHETGAIQTLDGGCSDEINP